MVSLTHRCSDTHKEERKRGNTEAARVIILAYAESVRNVVAGRLHADRTLLQYDHSQRFRPLLPRFEIEQKVASQSAPSFETYCTREAEQQRLKRDRSYAGRSSLGKGSCTITSGRRRDEEEEAGVSRDFTPLRFSNDN